MIEQGGADIFGQAKESTLEEVKTAIEKLAGFDKNDDITCSIVTVGTVKTITETDGTRTLTTTITTTDPDNISITSVWS